MSPRLQLRPWQGTQGSERLMTTRSNGLLDGTKSVTDTILSAGLSGGSNITSGTIYMEITLKSNPSAL